MTNRLELTDEQLQAVMTAVRAGRNSADDTAKAYRNKWRLKSFEEDAMRYYENESRVLTSVMKLIYDAIDGD